MPDRNRQALVTETFVLHGEVGHEIFPRWIARHAARLGLESRLLAQSEVRLDAVVTGPPELLDAMELGCSLGPQEVWVEEIERHPGNCRAGDESASPGA